MASHYCRKGSPYYWIRYLKSPGEWSAKSSGVRVADQGSKRKIAQMVAAETAKEAVTTDEGAGAFFARWVPAWIERHYTNSRTKDRAVISWSHLEVFFAAKRLKHPAEVSYSTCHDYVAWRTAGDTGEKSEENKRKPVKKNTAITELHLLSAVMQQALRRNLVIANPCIRVGVTKEPPKAKRAITREEEVMIFTELKSGRHPQWMHDCFLVGMRQGCRIAEVQVPLDRVNPQSMTIIFWTKGGVFHAAPLHPDLVPLVEARKAKGHKTLVDLPKSSSRYWRYFFDSIGLEDVCFHCTRVTVVTRLCEAGFSESQTMAYVGHASEVVHSLYRKMRPAAVSQLCAAL